MICRGPELFLLFEAKIFVKLSKLPESGEFILAFKKGLVFNIFTDSVLIYIIDIYSIISRSRLIRGTDTKAIIGG